MDKERLAECLSDCFSGRTCEEHVCNGCGALSVQEFFDTKGNCVKIPVCTSNSNKYPLTFAVTQYFEAIKWGDIRYDPTKD